MRISNKKISKFRDVDTKATDNDSKICHRQHKSRNTVTNKNLKLINSNGFLDNIVLNLFSKKSFFVWNIEYDFEFWIIWTINQNYHSLQYYMEPAPSPGHYIHICQLIYFKLILSLLDQSSCTVQHQFLIQHLLYCILTLYIIVLVIRYVPDQCIRNTLLRSIRTITNFYSVKTNKKLLLFITVLS